MRSTWKVNSPERALGSSFTLPLDKETTNMRPIPLVIRICSSEILEHFSACAVCHLRVISKAIWRLCHLSFKVLDIVFCMIWDGSVEDSECKANIRTLVDI